MKKFFAFAAALMMLSASAETLTLYDGTDYLAAIPFNGSWVDEVGNKTQVLFPAADLTDMVGKQITAITFYTEPEGCKLDGGLLSISLGETEISVMSNSYITEGLTQVGTCSFTAHEGEVVVFTIDFDTPYTYNGGNLLFENVVVEATDYQFTYWTGVKTNYNNCVVGSYGGASTRQFLPKTTFTYSGGGEEPEFIRGDVNGDKLVNITDVTVLINYLLTDDATGLDLNAADCNQDETISIADVTRLINFLLTDAWD